MRYTIIEDWDVYGGPMSWRVCVRKWGIWWSTVKECDTREEAETLLQNLRLVDAKSK